MCLHNGVCIAAAESHGPRDGAGTILAFGDSTSLQGTTKHFEIATRPALSGKQGNWMRARVLVSLERRKRKRLTWKPAGFLQFDNLSLFQPPSAARHRVCLQQPLNRGCTFPAIGTPHGLSMWGDSSWRASRETD